MHITADQLRAARALLHLSQWDAARLAAVPVSVVRQIEAPSGRPATPSMVDSLGAALEQAGAEFIPDGVRLRRPAPPRDAPLFDELRAISLRSAERLRGQEGLTDADLYGEDGLPA